MKLRTSWDRFLAATKRCSHRVRFNNTIRRRFVPARLCMLSITRACLWLPRENSAATASVKLANTATAMATTVVLVLIPDVTGRRASSQTARLSCSKLHDKCCDTAQTGPAAAGTVCRAAVDAAFNIPCDVAETCDGTSVSCPADAALGNGATCEDDQGDVGTCFDGLCANRDKECNAAGGSYYGGKWCTAACASQFAYYSPAPFHTFDADVCTEKLYCTDVRNSCSVGALWSFSGRTRRSNGFPCSTAAADGSFPSICYNGACTVDV